MKANQMKPQRTYSPKICPICDSKLLTNFGHPVDCLEISKCPCGHFTLESYYHGKVASIIGIDNKAFHFDDNYEENAELIKAIEKERIKEFKHRGYISHDYQNREDIKNLLNMPEVEFHKWYKDHLRETTALLKQWRTFGEIPNLSYSCSEMTMAAPTAVRDIIDNLECGLVFLAKIKMLREIKSVEPSARSFD